MNETIDAAALLAEDAAASAETAKRYAAEIKASEAAIIAAAAEIKASVEAAAALRDEAKLSSELVRDAAATVGRTVAEAVQRVEAAAAIMTAVQDDMANQVGDYQEQILQAAESGIETIREAALVSKTVEEIRDSVRQIRPHVIIHSNLIADHCVSAFTPFFKNEYARLRDAVLSKMPTSDKLAAQMAELTPKPKPPTPFVVAAAFGGGAFVLLCASALQTSSPSLALGGLGLVVVGAVATAAAWIKGGWSVAAWLGRGE